MEKEKEVRFSISKNQIYNIKKNTTPFKERTEMLDITCGYDGFICRVRQKGDKKTLEVKNYTNKNECLEQSINLEKVSDGVNYLNLIGMKPYLYLKRFREVRKYNDLKIFIDEFDILGNFVEIEYQDSNNEKDEIRKFKELIDIRGLEQDMYGGIVKDKLENDVEFRKIFEDNLAIILKDN